MSLYDSPGMGLNLVLTLRVGTVLQILCMLEEVLERSSCTDSIALNDVRKCLQELKLQYEQAEQLYLATRKG